MEKELLKMKKKKLCSILAVFMSLSLLLTGCGGGSSASSGAAGGGAASSDAGNAAAASGESTGKPGEGVDISFVCNNISDTYWILAHMGMQQACEELGCSVIMQGGTNSADMVQFAQDIDAAAAAQPDAIITICFDEATIGNNINAAMEKGVPVHLIDTDGPGTERLSFVGLANEDMGAQAADLLAETTGKDAKVALFMMSMTSVGMQKRLKGFQDRVAEAYPDMEIVTIEEAKDIMQGAQKMEQILLAYPEVNAVYAMDGTTCKGAAQTILDKNLQGVIDVYGLSDDEDIILRIMDGGMAGTVALNPFNMGYRSVYNVIAQLNGESYEEVSAQDMINVTKENVDSFETIGYEVDTSVLKQ